MRDEQASTWSAKEKKSLWLLSATVILPLAGSSITTWLVYNSVFDWGNFGFVDAVVFILLFSFSMGLAITPTTFVAVLVGFYLNWKGLYVVIPANVLAAILGYSVGKLVDAEKLMERLYASQNKIKTIIHNFKSSEMGFMFFVRISPILPFAFMNIVCSYLKIGFKSFVIGGTIGMLPRILLSVYAGSELRSIYDYWEGNNGIDFTQIAVLFFVLVSVFGIYFIGFRKKLNNN